MAITTRIWLVRHGEPAGVRGRCYGKLDVGLSATGQAQMQRAANALRAEPFDAIYASPRVRTLESARIVAAHHQCECRQDEGLAEIDFGGFEGLPYDEIAARYPDLYRQWMEAPTEVQFPNGESFQTMRARVLSAFHAIREQHEGDAIAIVTHGGVNRILLAWALEMPNHALFRLAQDYAAINLLTILDGVPILKSLNLTPDPSAPSPR